MLEVRAVQFCFLSISQMVSSNARPYTVSEMLRLPGCVAPRVGFILFPPFLGLSGHPITPCPPAHHRHVPSHPSFRSQREPPPSSPLPVGRLQARPGRSLGRGPLPCRDPLPLRQLVHRLLPLGTLPRPHRPNRRRRRLARRLKHGSHTRQPRVGGAFGRTVRASRGDGAAADTSAIGACRAYPAPTYLSALC
jgi:hypothetical protein